MNNTTNTEYDAARDEYQKAVAAISISRRKQSQALAWEWAAIAANHAANMGIENPRELLGTGTWPDLRKISDSVAEKRKKEILIVTRHPGFVEWLFRRGITGRVIERATPSDVLGMHCVGNLPEQLKAIAASFSRIAIPGCPPERRQDDLTADELDEYGAFLRTYTVKEIPAIQP